MDVQHDKAIRLGLPEIRVATIEDCLELGPNLRIEDDRECLKASGRTGKDALIQSVNNSQSTMVALVKGAPVCMFGCSETIPTAYGTCCFVWMLASSEIARNPVALMKLAPLWLDRISAGLDFIGNFVDVENGVHRRWLKRLGFKERRIVQRYGAAKVPFVEVVKVIPRRTANV